MAMTRKAICYSSKIILDKSATQTHTTVMKNIVLKSLPELMLCLIYNVIKFNSQVLTTTQSLKINGPSAPDFIHQLFPAYITCPGRKFHNYVTKK